MKYIKMFESFDDFSDDDLVDKLKWLIIENTEIIADIEQVKKEIKERKNKNEKAIISTLPKGVFNLKKNQIDWLLGADNKTGKGNAIAADYFRQLDGVTLSGHYINNQVFFVINAEEFMNDDDTKYKAFPYGIKSIKLLTDNLKKEGDKSRLGIMSETAIKYLNIFFYNDNKVIFSHKDENGENHIVNEEFTSMVSAIERAINFILEKELEGYEEDNEEEEEESLLEDEGEGELMEDEDEDGE